MVEKDNINKSWNVQLERVNLQHSEELNQMKKKQNELEKMLIESNNEKEQLKLIIEIFYHLTSNHH